MATITYPNHANGTSVHYYAGPDEPCHPALVVGNFTVADGVLLSADLIQLDAMAGGAIVAARRDAVACDDTITAPDTFHQHGCSRDDALNA